MTDLRTAAQQALDDLKDLQANHNIMYAGTISRLEAALAQEQAERERWAILLRAAGRVLQAFDDGYLQLDPETLQGGIAVDALREAWGAFVPARIQGGQR